ncbi:dermonecrotic toxin domain-containing protein [Paraburkholderia dinghuensis]|nr:DUF6543 domain-containing protein [Paraburkholderia dinghuensis]
MQVNQYVAPIPLYNQNHDKDKDKNKDTGTKDTAQKVNASALLPANAKQQRISSQDSDKDAKTKNGNRSARSSGGSAAQSKSSAPVASVSSAHHIVRRDAPPENPEPAASALSADGNPDADSQDIEKIHVDPESITQDVQDEFQNLFEQTKAFKEKAPSGDVMVQASNFIRDTIKAKTGLDIDPDQTYLVRFSGGEASPDGNKSVTGWQHKASQVEQFMSLTDFLLKGADDQWANSYAGTLNSYHGLYTSSNAATYGANNEVKILPTDLRAMFQGEKLEQHLNAKQKSFWEAQKPQWREMAKFEFSALAKKASVDGHLSRQGYEIAMKGAASNVALDKPAKMKDMEAEAKPDASVKVRRFDIDKYTATDILRMVGKDGRTVLYIPGSKQSFYEFKNEAALDKWVIAQTKDPAAQKELASHFSAYDRSTGNWGAFSKSGINEALANLASGAWDSGSINMANEEISGDAFSDMADRIRNRNDEDLTQISLKHETHDIWLNNLISGHTDSLTKPIERALSAGSFAELVGSEGGGAFAADTDFRRQAINEAPGMSVAATLLLAPESSAAAVRAEPPATSPSDYSGPWQKDFSTTSFPPGNGAEAMNEFTKNIQTITGQANPALYTSLSAVRDVSATGKDKTNFQRLQNSLDEVYKRLDDANKRLHDPNKKVDILSSLILSLDTMDENALNQAYERLGNLASDAFERFKLMKENDYRDIEFFERSDKSKPVPEHETQAPTHAFINLKDRHKMAINLEAPDMGRSKLSDAEAGKRYNVDLVDSIMNQLTRLSANTQDFMTAMVEETKDGFALTSAKTALHQFKSSVPNVITCWQVLGRAPTTLDDNSVRYVLGLPNSTVPNDSSRADAVKVYNRWTPANQEKYADRLNWIYSDKDKQEVRKKLLNDDVTRADILTSNADTAALYLRDIGGWRDYATPPGFDYFLEQARKKAPADVGGDAIRRRAVEDFRSAIRHDYKPWKEYSGHYEPPPPYWLVVDFDNKEHRFASQAEADDFYVKGISAYVLRQLSNPLGTLLQLTEPNATPERRKQLNEWGDNPIGKTLAGMTKAMGGGETAQGLMESVGRVVEGFIPYWGQYRDVSDTIFGTSANVVEGKPPTADDTSSIIELMKDVISGGAVKNDAFGGKTVTLKFRLPKVKKTINVNIKIPRIEPGKAAKATKDSAPKTSATTSATPTTPATASTTPASQPKQTNRPKEIPPGGFGAQGKPKTDQKGGTQDAPKATTADGTPAAQPRKTVQSPTQASRKNFRADRGGDALKTGAVSYKTFDQNNYSIFQISNPDGVSQGLSLEAIKRIDSGSASGKDLSSAVLDIRRSLANSGPDRKAISTSVVSQQINPTQTTFQNLGQQPTKRYDADRQMSINALENDIRSMAPGDVALLRTKIKGKHGETLDTGHMLVVQRTKDQQYQLFDSNNGVFKYKTEDSLSRGLEPYFDAAYSDKGVMAPDSFTLYKSEPAAAKGTATEPKAPDAQKPFGEHYDFPYIDADGAPGSKPATSQTSTGKPATDQPATPAATPASSPAGGSTGPNGPTDKASEPKPTTSQTNTGKPATDQPATPATTPASSPAGGGTRPEVRLNAGNVTSELPGLTAQGHLNAARYFTENGNPPLVIQDKQDVVALTRFFNEEGGKLRLLGGAPGGDGPSQPKRPRTDANDGQQPSTSTTNPNDGRQPSTSTTNANSGQQPAAPTFTGGGIYGGFYISDQLKNSILATVRANQRLADSTVALHYQIPTRVVTDLRESFNLMRTSGRSSGISENTRTEIKNYIKQHDDAVNDDIAIRFNITKSLAETIRQELDPPKVTGIPDQRKAEIVEYIRKNIGGSNDEIGKACGVSGMTISRLRHDYGLQKSSGAGIPLSNDRKIEIRDFMLSHEGLTNAEIGTRFGISITTVSRIRNDPGYVEAPLPVPSPLPAGLDLDAPLSPNSQKKVDDIKAGLDSTPSSAQPGTSGGSSAPAQSSHQSTFAQNVDADAPLPALRERDLQEVWNELGWVNPEEPTNPDLMRWMSKNLTPEELHRLADLPNSQVEGELGMIRRRANMPEEGTPTTPVATSSGSSSSTSSGSSTPSTQGSADASQSPARAQERAELEHRAASSPTPPADADAVITWLQDHRTAEEMKRIEKLPQDEFDAEMERGRAEMLAAQKQDAAPGPSTSGGVTNLNLQLTTDNVIRELPGLTPQGQQNAMNYLAPEARNPVPVLQNQQDIDNVTAFFNEGRSRPGLPGGDPASAGTSGQQGQKVETNAGQTQASGSGTSDAVSQGPSTSTNTAASQGPSTSTNTAAAPATQTSQSTSTVPNPEVITPSAGSLHERDVQIKKEVEQNHIPDPASPDYSTHIDDVVSHTSSETGVVKVDLPVLQKMAYKYNTIISIRPVDKYATGLIEEGYATKGFHIKGKSASWGPQAGLICADQKFSKLENTDSARIDKFNQEITKSIDGGDATKIPLELSWDRLQKLSDMGTISVVSEPNSKGARTFGAVAPSGKLYYFEATPTKNGNFTITSNNQPIEVLAPTTKGAKPFTADYDLFAVAPHLADVGPQDRVPTPDVHQDVFKQRVDTYQNKDGINPNLKPAYDDKKEFHKNDDPDLGNSSQRVANLVPAINDEIKANDGRPRENVAHHADDSTNPVTDQDANYPATFFLPYKMGRFDEICVIHDKAELKEMVQAAKDRGYNFPLNPLWDSDITDTRRKGFTDAKDNIAASGVIGSGTGPTAQGAASGSGGDGSGTSKTDQEKAPGSGGDNR